MNGTENWRGDKSMLCVLVGVIVSEAYFLDRCDDETLDPDTAVQRLEDITVLLQRLTPEERVEFIECLEELAAEAAVPESRAYSHDHDWISFLNSFAVDFGLIEDAAE